MTITPENLERQATLRKIEIKQEEINKSNAAERFHQRKLDASYNKELAAIDKEYEL